MNTETESVFPPREAKPKWLRVKLPTGKKYTELSASDIKEDCSYESLHNLVGTLSKNYYETAFGADAEKSVVNSITFYSDGRKLESNATNGKPVDVSEEKNEWKDKNIR